MFFWYYLQIFVGAQWLSGRVLDSRPKGRGFEPHRRHCVVSLSKNINPSLVLVPLRKTHPFITERLLMVRKESNKTKTKQTNFHFYHEKFTNKNCKYIFFYHNFVHLGKNTSIYCSRIVVVHVHVTIFFI